MWILFLIIHLIGIVGYSLVLRKALTEKADKLMLAVLMHTGIAVPMFIAPFFISVDFQVYDSTSIILVFIISILIASYHISNVNALQYLEASVYSVLFNIRIIITTILGILFLGENIVPLQIIGGILIFLAVILIKQKGIVSVALEGLYWGLGAALIISLLTMFEKKLITQVGFLQYGVPTALISGVFLWTLLILKNKRKIPLKLFINPKMLILMVFRSFSAYGLTLAFAAGGLLSVSTYISSLSVIMVVVFGIILLNENDFLFRKFLASVVAFIGLTLIMLVNSI